MLREVWWGHRWATTAVAVSSSTRLLLIAIAAAQPVAQVVVGDEAGAAEDRGPEQDPTGLELDAGQRVVVDDESGYTAVDHVSAGADWSRLAVAAGATLSAVFALYAVLWNGVVLSAGELAEPSPAFQLVWQLHAAAFALALPALGTTFIGAALAAHASWLTPPWQRLLGVAGGGLLLAAGAANLAIADGSALLFVGMPGYAAWLVWLLATGLRLVRARTADRPDNASTSDEEE